MLFFEIEPRKRSSASKRSDSVSAAALLLIKEVIPRRPKRTSLQDWGKVQLQDFALVLVQGARCMGQCWIPAQVPTSWSTQTKRRFVAFRSCHAAILEIDGCDMWPFSPSVSAKSDWFFSRREVAESKNIFHWAGWKLNLPDESLEWQTFGSCDWGEREWETLAWKTILLNCKGFKPTVLLTGWATVQPICVE